MMGNCQVRFLGEEGAATLSSLLDITRRIGLVKLLLAPLSAHRYDAMSQPKGVILNL